LEAERNRQLGLFLSSTNYDASPDNGLIKQHVRYREHTVDASVHQLIGDEISLGLHYRVGYAELKQRFPQYPNLGIGGVEDRTDQRGLLHTVRCSALYRHRSGFFGRAEGVFYAQDRERNDNSLPADDFWQVNLLGGFRFPRQRAEIAVGVLNLIGDDYRLDPINHYSELPRARTFYARLLVSF
jgi:hypothetical protein